MFFCLFQIPCHFPSSLFLIFIISSNHYIILYVVSLNNFANLLSRSGYFSERNIATQISISELFNFLSFDKTCCCRNFLYGSFCTKTLTNCLNLRNHLNNLHILEVISLFSFSLPSFLQTPLKENSPDYLLCWEGANLKSISEILPRNFSFFIFFYHHYRI